MNNNNAADTSSVNSNCFDQIADEMSLRGSLIDNEKAKTLAAQNDDYTSRIEGYEARFSSVYNIWKFDTLVCHVTDLQSVNVVYNLYDSEGNYVKNVVVTEDPLVTKVTDISEHIGAQYAEHTQSLPNWAGYELTANSFVWRTPPTCNSMSDPDCVWEARATWTQPSVSKPTDVTNPCRTDLGKQPCDLAIWVGLEDSFGGYYTTHAVQTGSDGKIVCTSSTNCTTSYFFWYQFDYTGHATNCSGFTFNPGNNVSARVTNKAKSGGSNTQYDVSIINLYNGVGCGVSGQSYPDMPWPNIATYINERAKYNPPNYATLAKFSTGSSSSDTMTGYLWYNGSEKGVSTPIGNGWDNKIRMFTSVTNIDYPVPSGNTMKFWYKASAGTG